MQQKCKILNQTKNQIIAILRVEDESQAFFAFESLIESGIKVIELSFSTFLAHSILEKLALKYNEKCLIGAGTILDSESARIAILNGAKFLVTPTVSLETIKTANRYSVPIFPGVFTPTEALTASEYGADVVKLFPASNFAPSFIKELKSPLPNINFIPTGGVNSNNIIEWKKAGAFAYGIGGAYKKAIQSFDKQEVFRTTKELLEKLAEK